MSRTFVSLFGSGGDVLPVAEGGEEFAVDAVSKATAQSPVDSPIQWNHTCGAGANKLIVLVGAGANTSTERNVSGVTYNGVALTQIGEIDDGSYEHAEIWRLNNPETGSALPIVVTMVAESGDANEFAAGAISFTGAHAAEGSPSSNTTTATNPTVTVVDSANGDIVVSIVASDAGAGAAMTEGGTVIFEDEDVGGGDSDFNAQRQVAAGGSTVCSWTCSSSSPYAAIGVAIKAA